MTIDCEQEVFEGVFLTLYSYGNFRTYYDSLEELKEARQGEEFDSQKVSTLEFVGRFARHDDVLKITYGDGSFKYLTAVRYEGYLVYNESVGLWEGVYGDLRHEYEALRRRGIEFMRDPYKEISDLFDKLAQVAEAIKKEKRHVIRPKDKNVR